MTFLSKIKLSLLISRTADNHRTVRREDVSMKDIDILNRYLSLKKLPCVINSPLRDDDKNPSFSIIQKGDAVIWKDFGTGEGGDITSLMARLWNVDYKEALTKISVDSGHRIPSAALIRKYHGKIRVTHGSSIKVKVRSWKPWDKEYWESYGISLKMCDWCNVKPISHAFFERDDGTKLCLPMDKYAYAYFEWKDDIESVKLYQPYSEHMKWLSKHDRSVWDLWRHAMQWAKKNNDCCIITSSRKDAMCLWNNLKIPSVSLQGEGYIPKPQVMKQVLDTFKQVYLWYDNDYSHTDDNPGQDNAKKLIELYPQLKNICIPKQYKCKDPSDLYKSWGKQMLKQIWEEQR